MNTYWRLLSYVKPFKYRLATAGACLFLFTLANSLVSLIAFIVVNSIQNQSYVIIDNIQYPEWLQKFNLVNFEVPSIQFSTVYVPFIVVAVVMLRGVFDYLGNYQIARVGIMAIRNVRDDLYGHLVRLSMGFYAKGRTGELMSRTVNDVGVIQAGVTNVIVDVAKQPFVILFNIPFVLFWGGPLAFIALLVFPLALIPVFILGKRLRKTERQVQEQIANINSAMQETFSGISVVKAYNMEHFEVRKFQGINRKVAEFLKRAVKITTVQRPLVEVMAAIGIAFAIWYGIKILPLDRFAAFIAGLFLFYEPLKHLSKLNATIQVSVAAGQRIFELMDEQTEPVNVPGAKTLERDIRSIEYRSVVLEYEPDKPVLQDVTFRIDGSEVVAIVGTSGAGKTSLVNLLLRFYNVTRGALEINGCNINEYEIHSLRDKIGLVTQETFLFNTSVYENISYGRLNASFEEVKSAAENAYASDFIERLPKGYGTIIGERGVKLSGGQKQRLAIARAILQNPPILILDEATSHLDTESERQVQKALEKLMKGRTVFVIAHRLSTVQNADRILVFDKGRLVQSGTNESLLNEGGVYKRLYDLQFSM